MKEININIERYNVNGICVGCLNYNRQMFVRQEVKECFKLLGDIDVPDGLSIQVCWECLAAVQNISRFQTQILKSFDILIKYSRKHTFLNSPSDFTKHATSRLSTYHTKLNLIPVIPKVDDDSKDYVKVKIEDSDLYGVEVDNMANNRHLQGSDFVSEQTLGSLTIPVSTIERDEMQFDDMIHYSDESDDDEDNLKAHLFQDSETQDVQETQEEYSNPNATNYIRLKREREISRDDKRKCYERKKKLHVMKTQERKRDHIDKIHEENETTTGKRNEQVQKNEESMNDKISHNLKIAEETVLTIAKKEIKEINNEEYSKKVSKKRWNRRNACIYCGTVVTDFSRHILRYHANETEVIRYRSINDKDPYVRKKKRKQITEQLRNEGNFMHNAKVSLERDGVAKLLPNKPDRKGTRSASTTCHVCFGTFKLATFTKHFRDCVTSNTV